MDEDFEYHVRHRAYELWLEAGRPDGKHQEFWELAESELLTKQKRAAESAIDKAEAGMPSKGSAKP